MVQDLPLEEQNILTIYLNYFRFVHSPVSLRIEFFI